MGDLGKIRKALAENPNDPRALKEAGAYFLEEGSFKQAQKVFAQAATNSPLALPKILLDYEREIEQKPGKAGLKLSLIGFLLKVDCFDQAIMELEELLDEDPRNVEAYNVLGRIYTKEERIDEAIALLERSIREGVRDVNLSETLAGAYLEKGRLNDAVRFYEEIIEQKPGDKQTLRILGELYARLGRFNQAACCYQAMFSDDPEVAHEVIKRLEDLLRQVEGSVKIREILADIYIKMINPEAAIAKLREIVRLEDTKLGETIQKLKNILKNYPNLPLAIMALAEALRRQRDYSEAAECYNQLIKAKPDYLEEAIRGYQEILELCPEQVLARAYYGEALLLKNDIYAALKEFGKMIEADPAVAELVIKKCRDLLRSQPQLLDAHIVLGQAYLAKGDHERAVIEAEGVIALDNKATGAYLLLGEAYSRLSELGKAAETLHTALLLEPFNALIHERHKAVRVKQLEAEGQAIQLKLQEDQWKSSLHLDLANCYLQKGEWEQAVRELQLVQKDPIRAPLALNLIGNIYRAEGRFDQAAAQYSKAIEAANPELAKTIRFNLGTTYEGIGDIRKAVKDYEAVLQEDIDFGNLKKRVKLLKGLGLNNLRNKSLVMAVAEPGKRELIALWGRDNRFVGRSAKGEDFSVSFGQDHNDSGFDYFMKGMYLAAEEEFNLAVQLDRNYAPALNNFAAALAKAGKLEEARIKMHEVVELDPGSAVYQNNLGVVYLLLGRTELARPPLEKSLAADPELSATCLNLGDLYYERKEISKAIELYRRAGEHDPLSELAASRLRYKIP